MIRPARSDKPLTLGLAEDLALGMGRSISYHFCAHLSGERERKILGGTPGRTRNFKKRRAAQRRSRAPINNQTNIKQTTNKRAVQI